MICRKSSAEVGLDARMATSALPLGGRRSVASRSNAVDRTPASKAERGWLGATSAVREPRLALRSEASSVTGEESILAPAAAEKT